MVFLGLSLTTWLVILGVFAIVTPIMGRQVAKDALRIKDSLIDHHALTLFLFPLHYLDHDGYVEAKNSVQRLEPERYIKGMILGGGLITLWSNFLFLILFSLYGIIGLFVYSVGAFFRGIFSTK